MAIIHEAAVHLRKAIGLDRARMAARMNVDLGDLCEFERDDASTDHIAGKYQEMFGVDLYVYAWCHFGDLSKLPPAVQVASGKLTSAWKLRVAEIIMDEQKEMRG